MATTQLCYGSITSSGGTQIATYHIYYDNVASRNGNTVTCSFSADYSNWGGSSYSASQYGYYALISVTLNGVTQSADMNVTGTSTSGYASSASFTFASASSATASFSVTLSKNPGGGRTPYDGSISGGGVHPNPASGSISVPAGGGYNITVTFNPGSGASVSPTSKVVANGSAIGDLPTPTYSGHDFNGWYNASGSQITSSTVISGATSQVLYASWSTQQYSITANLDGGSGTFNTLTKVYGTDKQIWTNTPTKDKYIFQYWQDQQGTQYSVGAYYTKDYANVLTAIWKKANIPVYIKQNNTLYQIEKAYTKVNNELKECTIYTKVGGQIKPII